MNINLLSGDRILRAYHLGYNIENIMNVLSQNQPSCANVQITDCQSLLSYAICLDTGSYAKYQLLNVLFPEISDTDIMLNKYSTGLFSTTARTCIANDWNSLVDVTAKVNNLANLEYQEYWELMSTVEAIAQSSLNNARYIILAGTVAAFFALQAVRYYDKYKLCKQLNNIL